MASNRFSKISNSIAAVLLTGLALSGCNIGSNTTPALEDVNRDNASSWAKAQNKPYPLGQPFMVNGCMVQTVRVAVDTPGININNTLDYTMAVANCETAKVTSTSKRCGKTDVCDTVHVEPKTLQADDASQDSKLELAPAAAQ